MSKHKDFVPLKGHVGIIYDKPKETAGGLLIPEQHREKQMFSTVHSVAEDITDLKPGDRVLVSQFAGKEVMVGKEVVCVVPHEDILGVFEEGDDNE